MGKVWGFAKDSSDPLKEGENPIDTSHAKTKNESKHTISKGVKTKGKIDVDNKKLVFSSSIF